jgi:type I restriction-modification system DNA methylase subunit
VVIILTSIEKTQHFSTRFKELFEGINFPQGEYLDPFAGDGILMNFIGTSNGYDIDPKRKDIIKRDTLLEVPDYSNVFIISNPPYLAKVPNLKVDKSLAVYYDKYKEDDLYKCALRSFLSSKGGGVIIPFNFFTDKRSVEIRRDFLSTFKVEKVNVFNKPMFDNTTISVCVFSFVKEENEEQEILFVCDDIETKVNLKKSFNYQIGGEWFDRFKSVRNIFGRLTDNKDLKKATHIFLNTLDRRDEKFNLSFKEDPYFGKSTDRIFATLTCERALTEEQERKIIERFNCLTKDIRKCYNELIFTNYRDYFRKIISYSDVYNICSYLTEEECRIN